jgi:hypothetical protein
MFDASDTGTVQSSINSAQSAFPDVSSAVAYIQSKWNNFVGLYNQMPALQHQAAMVAVQAAQVGRPDVQRQMQDANTFLGQLKVMAGKMIDEFGTLQDGLSTLGLDVNGNPSSGGAIPDSAFGPPATVYDSSGTVISDTTFGQVPVNGWTIGAAVAMAVLIAGTIGYVTYRASATAAQISTAQQAMTLLGQGKITPADATKIINQTTPPAGGGITDNLKTTAGYLALGAVAVFVLPDVFKTFGKRRR